MVIGLKLLTNRKFVLLRDMYICQHTLHSGKYELKFHMLFNIHTYSGKKKKKNDCIYQQQTKKKEGLSCTLKLSRLS